jgi:hypothetical protein
VLPRLLLRSGASALAVYVVWTAATYLLEGRVGTLHRPDSSLTRALYALVANILLGIALPVWVLHRLGKSTPNLAPSAGFRRARHTLPWLLVGVILGATFYVLRTARWHDPIVLLNAFAQLWPTSSAEVLVCWSLLGASVEQTARRRHSRAATLLLAASASSLLFGVYHLAHSPPFNSLRIILLLTAVGGFTSLFFFVSRDVYASIVLHNFFALFGVLEAMQTAAELRAFGALRVDLVLLALLALGVLVISHQRWLRHPPAADAVSSRVGAHHVP